MLIYTYKAVTYIWFDINSKNPILTQITLKCSTNVAPENLMKLDKELSKFINEPNKALIESVVGQIPVATIALSGLYAYRQKKCLERLALFLASSELDEEYLKNLFDDENTSDLFLEYVESVVSSQNNYVAVTLGIIYADNNLPKSIKSVAAQSLKGLSLASMHLFENICMQVEKNLNSAQLPIPPELKINLCNHSYGFSKLELQTYKQDLVSRNLVEQCGESNDVMNFIKVTDFSLAIWKRLNQAKSIIESNT